MTCVFGGGVKLPLGIELSAQRKAVEGVRLQTKKKPLSIKRGRSGFLLGWSGGGGQRHRKSGTMPPPGLKREKKNLPIAVLLST